MIHPEAVWGERHDPSPFSSHQTGQDALSRCCLAILQILLCVRKKMKFDELVTIRVVRNLGTTAFRKGKKKIQNMKKYSYSLLPKT